ncbi:MAG: hypothetical protein B7Y12_11210 [Rhizobiales bacterium 24-66-13]|uniref:hypothetical protein n=1 Tax=Xanthobacteraceae TaxID=335928 RepID=UPI000BD14509|nr:MAG: hypothetical protein B7Z41_00295 [Rhizobiales bacterium 12-66-7]OYX75282.1 MAG: hypothetical protein B7Y95_03085 [Rhizobiales bacterium 32-66-11]OYY89046.1 MAG: hypothetical protein B7Y61_00415 [Rhizobiales bacterium 35-66-30]OYZ76699.1 MAG: hypothetical protein B7Y12_11210 [Rhizobiales bacterium 24-66-13]OZB12169.1 MAG: hypothetical protein B7X67_00655 [Rhizobiales bacterium 39-66-18]
MDWISQNWIWIALAIGAFFFMTRMGGRGMGRSARHSHGSGQDGPPSDAGAGPRSVLDPVSRQSVSGSSSISSVYRERAYYFESRENREAFEADPEKYLTGMAASGQAIDNQRDDNHPQHHRHGC